MFLTFLMAVAIGAGPATKKPDLGPQALELHTDHGKIVLGLYPTVAPKHVAQILKLARAGVYDGYHFHRVHKGIRRADIERGFIVNPN